MCRLPQAERSFADVRSLMGGGPLSGGGVGAGAATTPASAAHDAASRVSTKMGFTSSSSGAAGSGKGGGNGEGGGLDGSGATMNSSDVRPKTDLEHWLRAARRSLPRRATVAATAERTSLDGAATAAALSDDPDACEYVVVAQEIFWQVRDEM